MARPTRKQGDRKVAVAYVRVSTDEQKLGPDAQRAAIQEWAEREGITVVAVLEDAGVSGKTPIEDRPGMLAALAALETHGAGLLVAAKRDRFAREMSIALVIEWAAKKAGAEALSIDHGVEDEADPIATLIRKTIDDMVAQIERLRIAQRTKAALAIKRGRGERVGMIPYGYSLASDGVHLVRDAAEQGTVALARELRTQGLSLNAIALALEAAGRSSRRGTRFSPSQVQRMTRDRPA